MVVSELDGLLCDQVRVQRVREAGEGGVTHLSGMVGTSWLACVAAHRQEAWEAVVSTQQRLSGRRKGHTNTTPRTPMDAHSRARTCTAGPGTPRMLQRQQPYAWRVHSGASPEHRWGT